jgi:hypothetical protein
MIEDWALEISFCLIGILALLGIFAKALSSRGEARRYRRLERAGRWRGTSPGRTMF